jgi:hypothetical protein
MTQYMIKSNPGIQYTNLIYLSIINSTISYIKGVG